MAGLWPLMLRPFRIRPSLMRWDRLGMRLSERADQERVERICEAVAGGFNAMICGAGPDGWVRYCEELEVHFRPFAHEGAAMGFSLRHPTAGGGSDLR